MPTYRLNAHGPRLAALLLALGLLLSQTGCEKTVPRTDYMPLRDGNRWEYRLLDLALLKRMQEGQQVGTAKLNEELKAGAEAAEESAQFGDPQNPGAVKEPEGPKLLARRVALELREAVDPLTYRAVYDTAEQVWSKKNGYIGFQSVRGRSYLLILPPHTGYKWIATSNTGQDLYYEVESAAGETETPAGLFKNCAVARQESRDRKEIFRYWFAPNVGLVRRSKYFHGEEVFRQELVSYKVEPATPSARLEEEREVRRAVEGKNRGSEFHSPSSRQDRGGRLERTYEDEKAEADDKPR